MGATIRDKSTWHFSPTPSTPLQCWGWIWIQLCVSVLSCRQTGNFETGGEGGGGESVKYFVADCLSFQENWVSFCFLTSYIIFYFERLIFLLNIYILLWTLLWEVFAGLLRRVIQTITAIHVIILTMSLKACPKRWIELLEETDNASNISLCLIPVYIRLLE